MNKVIIELRKEVNIIDTKFPELSRRFSEEFNDIIKEHGMNARGKAIWHERKIELEKEKEELVKKKRELENKIIDLKGDQRSVSEISEEILVVLKEIKKAIEDKK